MTVRQQYLDGARRPGAYIRRCESSSAALIIECKIFTAESKKSLRQVLATMVRTDCIDT